jgi:methylated-DNA-protein-cysteine methyltransferase-like protein
MIGVPQASMFEQIWKAVRRIPRGKVSTYGAVAEAAGFPGASRQVVWALRASKSPIAWHRVLGAKGRIRLPGENGLEQRLLLRTEGVAFQGDRVDMKQSEFLFRPRRRPVSNKKRSY